MFPDLSNDDEPPSILSDKVKRGELGMKAEVGLWNWDQKSIRVARDRYVIKLKAAIKVLTDS